MSHCGLLSRNEINMPKSRGQSVLLAQYWLGLFLRCNNVIYEQINLMPAANAAVSGKKLMVPSVDNSHLASHRVKIPYLVTASVRHKLNVAAYFSEADSKPYM